MNQLNTDIFSAVYTVIRESYNLKAQEHKRVAVNIFDKLVSCCN